jgi:predicted nuclease with TOPRIM domain
MEEKFYKEVNDSLKLVFDITSRIDERMKVLIENNNESKDKIEKLFDQHVIMLNRLSVLENKNNNQLITDLKNEVNIIDGKVEHLSERLIHVEKEMSQTSSKWAGVVDFIFKVGVVVIGSIILWKLGLKP